LVALAPTQLLAAALPGIAKLDLKISTIQEPATSVTSVHCPIVQAKSIGKNPCGPVVTVVPPPSIEK